jgi:putative DNA primase/helicase
MIAPPKLLKPKFENIPQALKARPRWVCWRGVWDEKKQKYTKQPINSKSGQLASSTDPATWSTFDQAAEYYLTHPSKVDGIGFVLTEDDPLVGVDVDHCVENGQISQEAAEIISDLSTYTEISPSGTGIRLFLIGKLPAEGRKRGNFEAYESARYLTVTGHRVSGAPETVEECQEALEAFHTKCIAKPKKEQSAPRPAAPGAVPLDAQAILDKAFRAKNGGKIRSLYEGITAEYGGDHSVADMALCSLLAFYTGNTPPLLDRLFRSSTLMREKWDVVHYSSGETYGQRTIQEAITTCTKFYEWDREAKKGATRDSGTRVSSESSTNPAPLNFDENYTESTLEALNALNEQFAVIRGEPQGIWDLGANKPISPAHFRLLLKNRKGQYTVETKDGEKLESKPLSFLWESWSDRREHQIVDILPEQPTTPHTLNLWKDWGGKIIPDFDASLWSLHLDMIFGLRDWKGKPTPEYYTEKGRTLRQDRDWFERWIAYPIQHPGAKLRAMALIWSTVQGIGKTAIADLLHGIYGEHFLEVESRFFESGFNGPLVGKLLVSAEEISCDGKFAFMDRLKSLVTSPRIGINVKHGAQYEAINRFNILATSNHPNALHLDGNDRRVFVHEVTAPKPPDEYFKRLYGWGLSQAGKDSLFTHLKSLDLGDFDPYASAPITESKLRMVDASKSDLDRWIADLEYAEDFVCDLVEPNALLVKAREACPTIRLQTSVLCAALHKQGYEVRRMSKTYKQAYLVAIRNRAEWRKLDNATWGKHWNLQSSEAPPEYPSSDQTEAPKSSQEDDQGSTRVNSENPSRTIAATRVPQNHPSSSENGSTHGFKSDENTHYSGTRVSSSSSTNSEDNGGWY